MQSIHIIVVNYNSGAWLRRALASALDHTDGLITVVDNASSDSSLSEAKTAFAARERINWIENSDNKGFAAANNQVLESLSSDYAVLMNPDCEINSETVPLILKQFESAPAMGLASCAIYNEDGTLQATCRRRFPTPWSALVRLLGLHKVFVNNPKFADFDYGANITSDQGALQFVEAISGAFMVVKREALSVVGLLDPKYFMHCEDLDWCKRFEQHELKVGFVAQASVIHAKGISSKSRPIRVLWTLHKGMNRFFDKHYKNQYSLPLRMLVKVGIYSNFLLRSAISFTKSLFNRI